LPKSNRTKATKKAPAFQSRSFFLWLPMKTVTRTYIFFTTTLLLCSIFCFSSCKLLSSQPSATINVGYCIDVLGRENASYNRPMLNSLESMENEKKIQLTAYQAATKENYKDAIQLLAKNNSIVFCTPLMQEECLQSSLLFPSTHFVVVDAVPFQPENMVYPETKNVTYLFFSDEEVAEIAGFIAAHIALKKPSALYFPGSSISPLKNRVYNRYVQGFRSAYPSSDNPIVCFTKDDSASGVMKTMMESNEIGSIFFFPDQYYASLVDDASVLSDEISHPCWSLFLLAEEQASHPFLGGVIRKNYTNAIAFVFDQYEKQGQLESVIECTRSENAFLFSPGLYSFSDSSLEEINQFLNQTE
jgi:hypothetical protein